MVGMPVGDPHELAAADPLLHSGRNLVRKPPRSEISVAGNPRIGHQHWTTVIADKRSVTYSLETKFHWALARQAREQLNRSSCILLLLSEVRTNMAGIRGRWPERTH